MRLNASLSLPGWALLFAFLSRSLCPTTGSAYIRDDCYKFNREQNGTRCGECFDGYLSADSDKLMCFPGVSQPIKYIDAPGPYSDISIVNNERSAVALFDADGDGNDDLFVGGSSGRIHMYRNLGFDESLGRFSYSEITAISENPLHVVDFSQHVGQIQVTFYDIDNDGDVDAFVGGWLGGIHFFRNMGFNETLGRFSFSEEITDAAEYPFNNLDLGLETVGRATFITFWDVDDDGDDDLFVGGFAPKVNFFENTGFDESLGRFSFSENISNASANPFHGAPLELYSNVAFVDIDQDGDEDAFVGGQHGSLSMFRNDGFNSSLGRFSFSLELTENNPFSELDSGYLSNVAFGSINGDGYPDAFVGSADGKVHMLVRQNDFDRKFFSREIGIDSELNPFYGTKIWKLNYTNIVFFDIDGDKDMDAFIGGRRGGVFLYLNKGYDTNLGRLSFSFSKKLNPFRGKDGKYIDFGKYSNVAFFDIDNDGDDDAFIGAESGTIRFFRNLGFDDELARFAFSEDQDENAFSFVNVFQKGTAHISFFDGDGDGNQDAFIGADRGQLHMLRNLGFNSTLKRFVFADEKTSESSNPFQGIDVSAGLEHRWRERGDESTVAFYDIDGDGNKDAFVSGAYGKIRMFRNLGFSSHLNHFKFSDEVTDPSMNPFYGEFDEDSVSKLAFLDVDGDGIDDVFHGSKNGDIIMYKGFSAYCGNDCTNKRGRCANRVYDFSLYSITFGTCVCQPFFSGVFCEQCSSEYYGQHCQQRCPAHSETRLLPGEKPFPQFPRLEDCQCNDGFVKVFPDNSTDRFECVCDVGYGFSNGRCVKCLPSDGHGRGQYSNVKGLETCQTCPENFMTFFPGQSRCMLASCPAFTTRNDASKDCDFACDGPDFYKHTLCNSLRNFTLNSVPLKKGHWRPGPNSADMRECPIKSLCEKATDTRNSSLPNNEMWSWSSQQYCAAHAIGVMCTSCQAGYFLDYNSSGSARCAQCKVEDRARSRLLFCLGAFLTALLCILPSAILLKKGLSRKVDSKGLHRQEAFRSSRRKSIWDSRFLAFRRCFRNTTEQANENMARSLHTLEEGKERARKLKELHAVNVRILLAFLQILLLYKRTMFSNQSSAGSSFFDAILNGNIAEFLGIVQLSCIVTRNFYFSLFLYTVVPLVVIGGMTICVFFLRFRAKRRGESCMQGYRRGQGFALWASLQLLLLVYPGVSSTILRTFDWDEFKVDHFTNEVYYALRADYSIGFDSETSHYWRIYATVMIFVYPVGVIVGFALLIRISSRWTRRFALADQDADFSASATSAQSRAHTVQNALAFLHANYVFRYFECAELVRRFVLTSGFLLVFNVKGPQQGTLFFQVWSLLAFQLVVILRPYKSRLNGIFALVSNFNLVLLAFVGKASADSGDKEEWISTGPIIADTIMGLELFVFALVVYEQIRRGRKLEEKEQNKQRLKEEPTSMDNSADKSFTLEVQ